MATGIIGSIGGNGASLTYTPFADAKVMLYINCTASSGYFINGTFCNVNAAQLQQLTFYVGSGISFVVGSSASCQIIMSALES